MAEVKEIPAVKKDRSFECEVCGDKLKAKTHTAVCTGTDLGVLVFLPDGEAAVYKNGLDEEGNPALINGEVVAISREDGYTYKPDGSAVLGDKGWEESSGPVPGSHKPTIMKEVK